jgi:hypothetical protein
LFLEAFDHSLLLGGLLDDGSPFLCEFFKLIL